MPVLDTNVLIRAARQDPAAVRVLERLRDEDLVVPSQAAAEYLAGIVAEDRSRELERLHRSYRVEQGSDEHILAMADLRAQARADGYRPGWGDVRIAAAARLTPTYVVTSNKRDFTRLGVPAWNYMTEDDPPS